MQACFGSRIVIFTPLHSAGKKTKLLDFPAGRTQFGLILAYIARYLA